MNILLLLIPLSLLLLGAAVWMFVWAVRRGQFEDLDTPALDILREDAHDRPAPPAAADPDPGTDTGTGTDTHTGSGNGEYPGTSPGKGDGDAD